MPLRITAGEWRGRSLKCLDGLLVRPTPSMVRAAIFNVLSDYFPCRMVLDLYAGCGTLGLEALSRGGQQAVLVEKDPRAALVIIDNLQKLGAGDRAKLQVGDALKYLTSCTSKFDLILADPPYAENCAGQIIKAVADSGALGGGGCLVLQHSIAERPPLSCGRLEQWKTKRYGRTQLSLYRNRPE